MVQEFSYNRILLRDMNKRYTSTLKYIVCAKRCTCTVRALPDYKFRIINIHALARPRRHRYRSASVAHISTTFCLFLRARGYYCWNFQGSDRMLLQSGYFRSPRATGENKFAELQSDAPPHPLPAIPPRESLVRNLRGNYLARDAGFNINNITSTHLRARAASHTQSKIHVTSRSCTCMFRRRARARARWRLRSD